MLTLLTRTDTVQLAQEAPSLKPYLPLVLLFVLALGFAVLSVLLGPLVGAGRMPVAYYITAMMFILFDIEMVFLYPFAVQADALGTFGLVEILLFIATVGFAYAYVWRRGGLDWN